HELRTPLTAMRSVGEVALQEGGDPGRYREAIGSMLEEVDRLTRLVESLLLLTRADAGSARLAKERLDIAALAKDVVEHMKPLAEDRSQIILLDEGGINGSPHGLAVAAERITLRHALINLLDNAIKYSPAGATIRVAVSRDRAAAARIAVSDQGPGIPLEEHARIFERFYRLDPARSREAGGAGLGLSIAKWAVEANGGRIEVQSEPGHGATFCIIVPQAV
ncbi:MAG: ATP-binding protein, partial [Planctomycetes bacterium]|nr:ATP-binding protein [Planctomycetota bacterium]